jgi:KAP family P-loop domain
MALFISQSPTSPQLLFDTRPDFVSNLESITTHVAHAAHPSSGQASMTFAIYGKWGSGKSTSLRFLERSIRERAESEHLDVEICQVDSPLWERLADARAALAYEIVQTVSSKAFDSVTQSMEGVAGRDPSALPSEQGLKRLIDFLEIFKNSPATPMLERWMRDQVIRSYREGQRAHAGETVTALQQAVTTRTLIILIDDLDRCNRSFTADMLKATSYWQSVEGLSIFFVIAADKSHLVEAIREHGERGAQDPAQALEKYVHLSVEMPSFLDTPDEVASFLNRILDSSWEDDPAALEKKGELKDLVNKSAKSYPNCVFTPLFRSGGGGLTPRTVKHRFNTFLAEFKPEAELREEDLKQWVLKAFWPDVWWHYLWNLRLGPEQCPGWEEKTSWIDRLNNIGSDLLNLLEILQSQEISAEELAPTIGFLARKHNIDSQEIDPDLAIYLAAKPQWRTPTIGTLLYPDYKLSGQPIERRLEPIPDSGGQAGEPVGTEAALTPDNQILYRYWQAERAEEQGNRTEAARSIQEIAAIVRQGGYGTRSAGTIGNAALLAERLDDYQSALQLHLAAHQASPSHRNVAQNLVEFIIDRRLADFYDDAARLLAELRDHGRDHKPTRTALLSLRLAALTGTGFSADERSSVIESFMAQLDTEPTVAQLTEIFSIGYENLPVDIALRACRTVCEAVDSDEDKYRALRILADYLANNDSHAIEAIATDIYLYLLRTGLACLANEAEAVPVKHNLAALLNSQDYDKTAALLWEDVYRSRAGDENIRRAFAICLSGLNLETAAAAVLVGQELPTLDLTPDRLPHQFSRDVDRWWERLPVESHQPCSLPPFLATPNTEMPPK